MRSQRLQRFFRNFDLDYAVIAKAIVSIMGIPQPWILSTDRTEWSFGTTRFNILLLGIVHEGIAYPVVWKMLDKKGNSNSDERMDLLDRFYKIFPHAEIAYLTGDREFVGKQWFTYLLIEPTIPFRLSFFNLYSFCPVLRKRKPTNAIASAKMKLSKLYCGHGMVKYQL